MTSYFRYLISEHRIMALCITVLIAISSFGCGSNSTTQSTEKKPADTQSAENLSVPLPPELGRHLITDTKLTAQLIIDNDTAKPIDLVVNTTNKSVAGNIDKVKGGTHTFEIIYYIDDVKVASVKTTEVVAAGTNNVITFLQANISYFDDDRDGFTNLAELEMGTNYNDATSKKVYELPRSSTDYILTDTMGISPSDGKTTVVGQSKSSNYTIDGNTSVAGQSKST